MYYPYNSYKKFEMENVLISILFPYKTETT